MRHLLYSSVTRPPPLPSPTSFSPLPEVICSETIITRQRVALPTRRVIRSVIPLISVCKVCIILLRNPRTPPPFTPAPEFIQLYTRYLYIVMLFLHCIYISVFFMPTFPGFQIIIPPASSNSACLIYFHSDTEITRHWK